MKNLYGLRRVGQAAMLLRGHNGRAIRQHLSQKKTGGALSLSGEAPRSIPKTVVKIKDRTYIPLKFRL